MAGKSHGAGSYGLSLPAWAGEPSCKVYSSDRDEAGELGMLDLSK